MAFTSNYTGPQIDQLLGKFESFEVHDQSWFKITCDTLNLSDLLRIGNYVFNGSLVYPTATPVYGIAGNYPTGSVTGSYMIIVRVVNGNYYQWVSSYIGKMTNALCYIWVRTGTSYSTKVMKLYEESTARMTFIDSASSDIGNVKLDKQIRHIADQNDLLYYDIDTRTYKSIISGMDKSVYGNVSNVFNIIDSHLSQYPDFNAHESNTTIHVSAEEKANYDSKLNQNDLTPYGLLGIYIYPLYDHILDELVPPLQLAFDTALNKINTVNTTIDSHSTTTSLHPTAYQISNWDSKAEVNHTHTDGQIIIKPTNVTGVVSKNNIGEEANQKTVPVTDQAAMLSLTTATVHNGYYVFITSTKTLYQVIDENALNNINSYKEIPTGSDSSFSINFSNISDVPTTLTGLCSDAIMDSEVDTMVSTLTTKKNIASNNVSVYTAFINNQMTPNVGKTQLMESLIDLIDQKMKSIRSIIQSL